MELYAAPEFWTPVPQPVDNNRRLLPVFQQLPLWRLVKIVDINTNAVIWPGVALTVQAKGRAVAFAGHG